MDSPVLICIYFWRVLIEICELFALEISWKRDIFRIARGKGEMIFYLKINGRYIFSRKLN